MKLTINWSLNPQGLISCHQKSGLNLEHDCNILLNRNPNFEGLKKIPFFICRSDIDISDSQFCRKEIIINA